MAVTMSAELEAPLMTLPPVPAACMRASIELQHDGDNEAEVMEGGLPALVRNHTPFDHVQQPGNRKSRLI